MTSGLSRDITEACGSLERTQLYTSVAASSGHDCSKDKNRIFDGYCVESKDYDSVITFDLPSGKQWRKRIWPRKYHPQSLHRWSTAEEILSYLISFDQHEEWISTITPQMPPSGTILFFDRKQTKKYRSDGYDWKTRKTSNKQVREDRMKLKVAGYQLLYGCYAHSASNPDFHRRTYWLLQNPNIIMVHYLEIGSSRCVSNGAHITSAQSDQSGSIIDDLIAPSNWDLLSISDCNLCALLNMTTPGESISTVLTQLAMVLALNLQRAATLEEAIDINNTGLPVDKFEESRSKKVKKELSDVPVVNSMSEMSYSMSNDAGTPLKESSSNGAPSVGLNTSDTSTVSNSKKFLQVLSKSPHIIVCYPPNGPMSYVLTVPTTNNKTAPHSGLLSSPIADKDGKLPLPPNVYLSPQGEPPESTTESSPLLANKAAGVLRPSKGKERVTGGVPTVTQVLSCLLKNNGDRVKLTRTTNDEVQNEVPLLPVVTATTTTRQARVPTATLKEDYSPESFTEFAKNLLTMDPLEASRMEDSSNVDVSCPPHENGQTNEANVMLSSSPANNSFGRECSTDRVPSCYHNGVGELGAESMDVYAAPDELVQDGLDENCIEMSNSENQPPPPLSSNPCLAALVSAATGESLPVTCTTTVSTFPTLTNNPAYVEAQDYPPLQQQNITTSFYDADTSGSSKSSDQNALLQSGTGTFPDISLDLDADTLQQLLQMSFSSDSHCSPTNGARCLNDQGDDSTVTPEMPLSPISRFMDNLSPPSTLDFTQQMSSSLSFHSPHTTTNQQDHLSLRTNNVDNLAPHLRFQSSDPNVHHPSGGSRPVGTEGGVGLPDVVVSTSSTNSLSNDWSSWTSTNTQSIEQWLQESNSGTLSSSVNNSSSSLKTSLGETPVNSHSYSTTNDDHSSLSADLHVPPDIHEFVSKSNLPPNFKASAHSNFSQFNHLQTGETSSSSHLSTLDSFVANDSFSHVNDNTASSLPTVQSIFESNTDINSTPTRKVSNTSTTSEPLSNTLQVPSTSYDHSDTPPHLSLPNLTLPDSNMESSSSGYASPIMGGRISSPIHNMGSVSPSALQDIPEGIQMELESYMQYETEPFSLFDYRSNSPPASSPSLASVSSRSTVSIQDASIFDSDTPSVVELCEMLSESANVKHHDFSHMTLTESEQRQLFHAAEVIQGAFRKYKVRRQTRDKQKSAALLIENYYKKYREVKQQKDQAARRIQQQYRVYKNRTRELNRAAACVQQMYRYHHRRQQENRSNEQARPTTNHT